MKVIFVSILILVMMAVACRSASSSVACSTDQDEKMKCTESNNHNGGIAVSGSRSGSWGIGKFPLVMFPGMIPFIGGKILKGSCQISASWQACHEWFQTQTIPVDS
ncbi:hypothetical protein TNCV_5010621 [Trichonephila clavipes]|nr:hypothetical protein TNCV_5010621 [Trichonephila clavipes]